MEKRAVRSVREKRAKDDWTQNLLQLAKDNPMIAGSLLGAGGGGLFGLLSSYGRDKEDRNSLGSALTGALGGGLLGLGGGAAYKYRDAIKHLIPGVTDDDAPEDFNAIYNASVDRGEVPSVRDPNTPLSPEDQLSGNHGILPSELLDLKNRLGGMSLSEVNAAVASGDLKPAHKAMWALMQNLPSTSKPEERGFLPSFGEFFGAPLGMGPTKPKFEDRQYAKDPNFRDLSDPELEGYAKGHEAEMQAAFDAGRPSPWSGEAAAAIAGGDILHAGTKRVLERGNVANAQSGAKGNLADLASHNIPEGGESPAAAAARQTESAQNTWIRDDRNKKMLAKALREAREGSPRAGVQAIVDHSHATPPGVAGGGMSQARKDVMARLNAAHQKGIANEGGRQNWWGGRAKPHDTVGSVATGKAKPRRLWKGGLKRVGIYGLLPMIAGHFRTTKYDFDPKNYTMEGLGIDPGPGTE